MLSNYAHVKEWKVLIVDDDPDNLIVAEKVLAFYGAKVHTAEDGKEGLKILKEMDDPTFLLLDLSMPEMDGWEMIKEIRKHTKWASLPIIAVTAHALKEDKERVQATGFNGYIAKPFMLNTFMDEIHRCLKQKPGDKNKPLEKMSEK